MPTNTLVKSRKRAVLSVVLLICLLILAHGISSFDRKLEATPTHPHQEVIPTRTFPKAPASAINNVDLIPVQTLSLVVRQVPQASPVGKAPTVHHILPKATQIKSEKANSTSNRETPIALRTAAPLINPIALRTAAPLINPIVLRTAAPLINPIALRTAAPLINSNGRSLTFICPDHHNGTARDIAAMIGSRQGQAVLFEFPGLPLLEKYPQNVHRLAHYVRRIFRRSRTINEVLAILRNHSETLKAADALICAMPSAHCEGLLGLNKTVIFAPALRFSYTRCTKAQWEESVRVMRQAVKSRKPRHFVAAMSRYDAEYVKYFTGIDPLPLYASAAGYVPQAAYHPTRPEVLIGPLALKLREVAIRGSDAEFAEQLAARKEFKFATARDLYWGKFSYAQVAQHPAAVILPYAVMSIGLTELYAMGIPLFVPSAKLMRERPRLYPNDRTMTGLNKTYTYCGKSHSIVPEQDPASNHTFSPESLTQEAKFYWLQFADFYQWPHVTFFDSIADLIAKLQATNLARIHDLMMVEWHQREARLDEVWRQIASGLDLEPRHVPDSFFRNI